MAPRCFASGPWCSPCKRAEQLRGVIRRLGGRNWGQNRGCQRRRSTVGESRRPLRQRRGWDYDILLDPNREFARAMNVNNVPHTRRGPRWKGRLVAQQLR